MSHFIPTLSILEALKTRCQALELVAGVPLFAHVDFYHTPDLVRALKDLHALAKRACVLIPGGDDFDNRMSGTALHTEAAREIIMLVTDQTISGPAAATVGDASNPGCVQIKDLVIETLLGEQLGFGPRLVRLRPVASEPIIMTVEDSKKQSGRQAYSITWHADAGWTSVSAQR